MSDTTLLPASRRRFLRTTAALGRDSTDLP